MSKLFIKLQTEDILYPLSKFFLKQSLKTYQTRRYIRFGNITQLKNITFQTEKEQHGYIDYCKIVEKYPSNIFNISIGLIGMYYGINVMDYNLLFCDYGCLAPFLRCGGYLLFCSSGILVYKEMNIRENIDNQTIINKLENLPVIQD